MNIRKLLLTGMTVLLGATAAMAAAPDSDSLTVRITPNVDLGVDIDTGTARFNHADAPGDLDIPLDTNATSYLISPASVTITGNFGSQEVEVVGQVSAGGWSLDTDEAIGADSLQVYALFAVSKDTSPFESDFAGANNLVTTSPQMAGQPTGDEATPETNTRYEKAVGMDQGANMDNLPVSTLRQLWLRLDTPSSTSIDSAMDMTVTLTAKNGFLN